MKRLMTLALALLLMLGAAACGNTVTDEGGNPPASQAPAGT